MVLARQIKSTRSEGVRCGCFFDGFFICLFLWYGRGRVHSCAGSGEDAPSPVWTGSPVPFLRWLHAGAENDAIGLLEEALAFRRDAISGKSDAVQPYDAGRIAIRDDIRADVLHDLGHAADHSTGADLDER